jgi:hypothetical protein
MHEPYLALYIKDGVLYFDKKLPTEDEPRGIIEVGIDEVKSVEFDEAAKKLGGTVLGIFRLWHKNLFQTWDTSNASVNKDSIETFSVALYLIDKLSQGCSEDRLVLIDEILSEASISSAAANKYLIEDWPFLRKRLLRPE